MKPNLEQRKCERIFRRILRDYPRMGDLICLALRRFLDTRKRKRAKR